MADNFSGCSCNGVCKRVEAYCLRSIFSRLALVSGRLENLWKRRRFLGNLLCWLKNTSAMKLENASVVHLLCMGVINEAGTQVTLASNSFMNIFWACNSIARELNLAVWIIYSQFVSKVGLYSYFQQNCSCLVDIHHMLIDSQNCQWAG